MSDPWQRIRSYPWRLIFLLCNAFGILLFFYRSLDRVAREDRVNWLVIFIEEMSGGYAEFFLIPLIAWLVLRFPLGNGQWKRRWPLYLLGCAIYGFLNTSLMYLMRLAVFAALGMGVYDYGIMSVRYFMEFPLQIVLFSTIVIVITFFEHQHQARERERRLETLERQLAQAQLESLQLQLQPHFLFNALNAVSSIVYEDPGAADRMIGRLSEFLRRVLRSDSSHEVTLRAELDLVDLYLSVMRARLEDRLQCSVSSGAQLDQALVPRLILQPVVENAIRYGVDPESGTIRLTVEARRRDGNLELEVIDRGPGGNAAGSNGFGLGLKNLEARLQKLYGANAGLTIGAAAGGGTRVFISLPFHIASEAKGA